MQLFLISRISSLAGSCSRTVDNGIVGIVTSKVMDGRYFQQQRRDSSDLSSLRRGKGGRSSFSGKVVTVFGATGYTGPYVVNRLAKQGCQIIIPYRCDQYTADQLKVLGDLGQILYVPINLRDEISLVKSMKYSNTVVNLIGADLPTKNFSYEDVHITGPNRIAYLAKQCGVEKFVHVSALNVTYTPPEFYKKGGSDFLRTKAYGEDAVRSEFPEAVIIRPADLWGHGDRFLHYWAKRWRRSHNFVHPWHFWQKCFYVPIIPMWKHGVMTSKMPLFVSDFSAGISAAINADNDGKTYEFVGPHRYRLDDLVDYMYGLLLYPPIKTVDISAYFRAYVWILEKYGIQQIRMYRDKLEREFISDTLTGNPTLRDLGINTFYQLEERMSFEIQRYRRSPLYWDSVGEFPEPELPMHLDEMPDLNRRTITDHFYPSKIHPDERLGFILETAKP